MNDEKLVNMIHLLKTKYTNEEIVELITYLILEGSKIPMTEIVNRSKELNKNVFEILKIAPTSYMVEKVESEILGYSDDLLNLIKNLKVDKTTDEYKNYLKLIESI